MVIRRERNFIANVDFAREIFHERANDATYFRYYLLETTQREGERERDIIYTFVFYFNQFRSNVVEVNDTLNEKRV